MKIVRNSVHPESFHFWGRNLFVIKGIYTHVILKASGQSAFLNRLTNKPSNLPTNWEAANHIACFSVAFLNLKMRGRVSSPKEMPNSWRCMKIMAWGRKVSYTKGKWGHVVFMIYIWWISSVIKQNQNQSLLRNNKVTMTSSEKVILSTAK